MRDPQKLIDEIHGFLARSDQTLTDDVRGLAGELNELCVAADVRLRRCEDYLRRGLVGEAIHLAEVEPAVLDVVGALDFQGRERWEEVLTVYALPVPPRVNLARAAALNQAYELHQTLEPLLREYRRLCLGRSPLGERMAVLRELARHDPGNPSWNDDLALCESPALVELRQAFEKAVPRGDLTAVAAVAQHIQTGTWSNPQAALLAQQAQAELQSLRARQARKELTARSAAPGRALERDDLAAVTSAYQPLFDAWQAAALPPEDAISQQLVQAAAWVQDAQQRHALRGEFDRHVAAFQALLVGGKAGEDALEDGYGKLDRFGLPIPDAVRKGYRAAMRRYEQERNARARGWDRLMNLLLLCIALPVSLVVLAILGVVLYRILRGP